MCEDYLVRKQIDRRCGKSSGAFNQRKGMRFRCQPRLAQSLGASRNGRENPLCSRHERTDGLDRDLSLTICEEDAQVTLAHLGDDHSLAELRMLNALPRCQNHRTLRQRISSRHEIRGW